MSINNNDRDGGAVDLDTALSMTGRGKFVIHLGMVVGGTLASVRIDNLGLSFVLPAMGCELGLSTAERGLFLGATCLGMVLTTCGWGMVSDTYGRRNLLLLSTGVFWLSSVGSSLAPTFWLMVILRFIAGITSSGIGSIIYAYMAEFLPPKDRVKYLSHSCIFIGIAYCIIPGTAWLILPLTWSLDLGFVVLRPWRILCLLNGSFILAVFLGLLGLPESPKFLISIDKHEEALDVLREVFSRNTGRPPSEYPVRQIRKTMEDERTAQVVATKELPIRKILKEIKNQVAPIFGKKYITTTIMGCILQLWLNWSIAGLYIWLPEIQNRMMIYNNAHPNATVTICGAINTQRDTISNVICQTGIKEEVYVTFLAMGVNYIVGFALSGFLMNYIGKRIILSTLQLISGLASFGLLWATDQIWLTIFAILTIAQGGLSLPLLNSMLADLYPTYLRTTALCINSNIGRVALGIAAGAYGSSITHGCVPTIFSMGAITLGTGFLSLYIPKPSTTIKSDLNQFQERVPQPDRGSSNLPESSPEMSTDQRRY